MSALVFRITGDSTAFKAAMGEVGASLSSTASRVDTLSSKLGSLGGTLSLGITAPVAALAAATVRSATSLDSLTRGLEAVSGSAEAAQAQLVSLREVAKLPGLGFREAIQLSTQLQAAGFSAELSERSLKAFGNALATVGKGKAELGGVAIALSQIAAKGKISQEEVNQLAERIPQIRVAIKAAFGTADTEVIQKLGVSSQEFVTKIVAQLEKLKQVTGGPQNAFENLTDTIDQASARVGAKLLPAVVRLIPVLETIAISAANVVDAFTRMPQPIQAVGLAIGAILVISGPVISAYRGIAGALTAARDAYIAMTAAQAASAGAGIVSTVSSAASAAKGVADAAAQIRAAKVALDAAVGIGYAETLAAQGALKAAQAAYLGAVEVEKAAITLGGAARTATIGLGALAGATVGAGIAVATVVSALNTSTTALEEQKRAADESADSMKRLNDRFKDFKNVTGQDQKQSFADFDRNLENRITQLTQKAKEGDPKIEGLISALKAPAPPSIKSILADAGVKQGFAEYKEEIDKLRTAEKSLLELQASGQNVGKDLAIVRKKLADAMKELATATGETAAAENKITVSSVAALSNTSQLARSINDNAQATAAWKRELSNGGEIIGRFSGSSLVGVEAQERLKSAIGRVKDAMYEYVTAGTVLGRRLDLANDVVRRFITEGGNLGTVLVNNTRDFADLARRSEDYANSLRAVIREQEALAASDAIKQIQKPIGFPELPKGFGVEDSAKELGITLDAVKRQKAAQLQKELEALKAANKIDPAAVSGNDIIEAQRVIDELLGKTTQKTERLSRGLQQVSTIITDLSRSVSNSAIDLLFTKPVADTSRFEEQLVSLRAEQDKLTAAQRKGQNVTAALTENQRKMAQVNQQMADAVKRTSLSFRAMEALKNIAADVAKSITRLLIEGALKRLGASLLNIGLSSTKVFTGIASSIGGLFGSGAKAGGLIFSAAGGGAQAATTAASSGAKVAGTVGSIAGAGLSATIGAVAGVGSLISGIVGNFQMKGMNKTLDLIEKSSRYTEAYTLSLLEKTNEFLPKLADIHQRLIEFRQLGIKLEDGGSLAFAGGSGDSYYFDFSGANLGGVNQQTVEKMFETAVIRFKQKGLSK